MEIAAAAPPRAVPLTMDIEAAYRRFYKNVYNYISFRINNHHDAEELASLVFTKALAAWKSYNPAYSMEAWLISIAKNCITDYFRLAHRRNNYVELDNVVHLAEAARGPEEVAVFNEDNRRLIAAMSKLSDTERQILSMKFATDLKHSEIAAVLGISESLVGVMCHRSIKKLRKLLGEVDGQ